MFVIAMEVLSNLLNKVSLDPSFKFHKNCKKLKLFHLCFIDDLMLFCKADKNLINCLFNALEVFGNWLRLEANNLKGNFYCSEKADGKIKDYLREKGFVEGTLPFKYLGIPLGSSRINSNN